MKKGKKVLSLLVAAAVMFGSGQFALSVYADEAETGDPGAAGSGTSTAEDIGVEGEDYAEGEVIVVFEKGTTNSKIGETLSDNDASLETKTRVDGSTVALATLDEGTQVSEAIESIGEDQKVAYVQPNYKYSLKDDDPYLDPSSKYYQKQFAMTKAKEAWSEIGSVSSPVTVAVLDTGADLGHEDLKGNLVSTAGYMQFGSGFAKTVKDDADKQYGHGTHVAGIIGAVYGNGKGGAGVAAGSSNQLVKVLPVGATSDGESLFTMDIVRGMNYAASQGADVINMSFGAPERDRVEGAAIKDLYYDKGIVFVAASGNEASEDYNDPSDMKEVISVCNYDVDGSTTIGWKGTDSNYGAAKDISAPGQNILSTVPGSGYAKMSGTSMASPVVSGICALVLDANPELTPEQVRNIICATADENSVITESDMGYGTVNALAAVRAAKAASSGVSVDKVMMKSKSVTLEVEGATMTDKGYGMEALVLPAESLAKIVWSSDDESVATVDENGNVIAKAPGTCHITAYAGGVSDTCTVTVKGNSDPTGISFTQTPKELAAGEWYDLGRRTKIVPASASNQEIYWSSSNNDIAIAEAGYLEAKAAGKCTITAETYNGHKTSFVLTVTAVPKSVKFTRSTSWMRWGTTFDFNAQLTDSSGKTGISDGDLNWAISPKSCGTITSAGKFTPNKAARKNGYVYVGATAQAKDASGNAIWDAKKIIILKKNYKGKTDYRLAKRTVKKRRVTIRWKKIPAADRYVVQRAVGSRGKFKTIKTINAKVVLKNSGTITYTNKNLAKNRIYRYRVKAQFKENGARKSFGWSNTVKVRTKK